MDRGRAPEKQHAHASQVNKLYNTTQKDNFGRYKANRTKTSFERGFVVTKSEDSELNIQWENEGENRGTHTVLTSLNGIVFLPSGELAVCP